VERNASLTIKPAKTDVEIRKLMAAIHSRARRDPALKREEGPAPE
jgi:hypothetical protein